MTARGHDRILHILLCQDIGQFSLRLASISDLFSRRFGKEFPSRTFPGGPRVKTCQEQGGGRGVASKGAKRNKGTLENRSDFLTKLHRSPRRKRKKLEIIQKLQWRQHPETADFCPLSWSNASWEDDNLIRCTWDVHVITDTNPKQQASQLYLHSLFLTTPIVTNTIEPAQNNISKLGTHVDQMINLFEIIACQTWKPLAPVTVIVQNSWVPEGYLFL